MNAETRRVNRRAKEVHAAVRYEFKMNPDARRGKGRLVLERAVVMSQKDSNTLSREHKEHRRATARS